MSQQDVVPTKEKLEAFWQAFAGELPAWSALDARSWVEAANQWLAGWWPDIAFEAAGNENGTPERLIVTAHGVIEQFPLVQSLVDHAPALSGLRVEAFRQRVEPASGEFGIGMDGFSLSTAEILVHHYADCGQIALEIGFAKEIDASFESHAQNMAFILLDHAIGEYDFAVKVGPVDFVASPKPSCVLLSEFAPVFDQFWRDDLGHNQIFPETDQENYALIEFSSAEGEDAQGLNLLMLNESANAVAMRADLVFAMSVKVPVSEKTELETAQLLQYRLEHLFSHDRSGILAYTLIRDGYREHLFYVANSSVALASAEKQIGELQIAGAALSVEADYRWDSYYQYYSLDR
jgi:hypothetical protein